MQDWMARNMPQTRAVTAGAVRFWYNVWHDLPQLGGGSEQGLTNQVTDAVDNGTYCWALTLDISTLWMADTWA